MVSVFALMVPNLASVEQERSPVLWELKMFFPLLLFQQLVQYVEDHPLDLV